MPVLAIVAKRFASNRLLTLVGAIGLIIAVTLVTAIPLYANAIATQALRRDLSSAEKDLSRPKAAILFSYITGRATTTPTREQFLSADTYLRAVAPALPGLLPETFAKYVQTDAFPLIVERKQGVRETRGDVFFASLEDFLAHVDVVEGTAPDDKGELQALISTEGLDELGLAVGMNVDVVLPQTRGALALPVRIVGRWQPKDEAERYWFNRPDYYKNALFLREDALFRAVLTSSPRALREYTWYSAYDPSHATVSDVERLLGEMSQLRVGAQQALRGLKVDSSLDDLLDIYRRKAFFLQILLFVTGAPILAIILQFVASAASMLVEGQKDEIATLKSRGATTRHIVGVYLAEWTLLGGIAVVVGLLLGSATAQFIGFNTGFLSFGVQGLLPVQVGPEIIAYAIAAAGLGMLAAFVPALETACHSIVTYKQEVARSLRPGTLRRYFVDLIPAPLAAYSYYILLQRRSVLPVGEAGDTFSDPLLLLAPVLFIFAAAMLFLRLFPLLVTMAERLLSAFVGITILMALRQISRQPQQYRGLLLLLTLTVALGGFSASMAGTLDRNYADTAAYRVGADLRLGETGAYDDDSQEWTLVPVGEHLNVPEIEAPARVLRATATEKIGTRGGEVTVLGLDPGEFGAVVYWRPDYASLSLGELLGQLANDETAALVDRRLAEAYRLQIGDQIGVGFKDQTVEFTVAGVLDYFPTLYPRAGRFLVANVDYLFTQIGSQPYDVWVKLRPGTSGVSVVNKLIERDVPVVRFEELRHVLADRRLDSTRLAVFGILSVGFLIAALLTVLGVLLYSYLSFRRQLQQMGILRAIGLSLRQLTAMYLIEQSLLLAVGVGAGTLVGYVTSLTFIPFLQVNAEQNADVPPFLVAVAWQDLARLYVVLIVFLALALPFSLTLLRRMRIYDAIKLGEERG